MIESVITILVGLGSIGTGIFAIFGKTGGIKCYKASKKAGSVWDRVSPQE